MPRNVRPATPPRNVPPAAPTTVQTLAMGGFGQTDETIKLLRSHHHIEPCLPHAHDDFVELVYIEAGKGTHYIANASYQVSLGDICIINTGIPHHFEPSEGCALTIVNCLVSPEFLEREFPERENRQSLAYRFFTSFVIGRIYDPQEEMRLRGKDTHQVKHLLDTMLVEYAEAEVGYIPLLEGYMRALLYLIIRIYSRTSGIPRTDRVETVQRIMQYLREHCCADTKVTDVARLFFISPKYLCRLFKHHTGQTIIDYIQEARIEMAIGMLASSTYSIRTIATDVGYNDVTFFYRLFRQRTGLTPGEYRARLAGSGAPPETPRLEAASRSHA
jgi:AraC-like DNA-binding protein/mannose-6-phosphate isomerase-like protein (cupin superfamily)